MANNEHSIRFIDSHYKELFRIPDGGSIYIDYPNHPEWSHTAECKYIDDYHTRVGRNVFHICEFAEKMEASGATYQAQEMITQEEQDRLTEAMEAAGLHYDAMESSPYNHRFISDQGTVTHFESWNEVNDWLEGVVFDDPDIADKVDSILHPEKQAEEKITVLVIKPEQSPEVQQIGTSLEELQEQVGGMIEVVYPFDDNVGLIMNEEGKINGLPLNRGLFDENGHLYDVIAGTFLVTGLTEDNFGSLTPEQVQKYSKLYEKPQMFVRMGREIVAFPIEPKKEIGTFELFHLKDIGATRYLHFESYDHLTEHGNFASQANYDQVYSGKLYEGENLDSIYERFNLQHPSDFRGHSLSVSDVIVVHQNGQDQAYYVDSFGFKQVPEFFADNPLKKVEELLEDDYGMIDGIINNGDRHKEQEEKKVSVVERLQEKKKEAAEAEASRPKMPKREKDHHVDIS